MLWCFPQGSAWESKCGREETLGRNFTWRITTLFHCHLLSLRWGTIHPTEIFTKLVYACAMYIFIVWTLNSTWHLCQAFCILSCSGISPDSDSQLSHPSILAIFPMLPSLTLSSTLDQIKFQCRNSNVEWVVKTCHLSKITCLSL